MLVHMWVATVGHSLFGYLHFILLKGHARARRNLGSAQALALLLLSSSARASVQSFRFTGTY